MRPFAGLGFRLIASAAAVAAAVGFAPAVAAAQEFELHPAYIEGTVEFGDSVVLNQGNVYAYAYDSSTGQTHNASTGVTIAADGHSGTYALTVEAGSSGLTYTVYAYSYANGYQATIYAPGTSAAVTEGDTTTLDFSYPGYDLGTVHTTVDVTGAGTYQYAYAYFYSVDPDTGISTNSNVYIPVGGTADALVGPGNAYAYGTAYVLVDGNQTYFPLGYQYFSLASGGEMDLGWSLDIDPVDPGSISGTISIDGEYVDLFYIYAYGGNPPQSLYTQVYGGGSFTFDPANPGSWSLYANAYDVTDDGGSSYYSFPYVYVTVAPGEDLSGVDFDIDPAYVEGTLTFGDWRDPSSSYVYVQAYSNEGAYTQYYKNYVSDDDGSTPYCLIIDADASWQFSTIGVSNNYNDGTNQSSNNVYGYSQGAIPDLDAGETFEKDISVLDYDASTLTLHLTIAGGGLLSNPQVQANGYRLDGDGNTLYNSSAWGNNYGQYNVSEGTVTLTLAPGVYDITATAQVNGSWTTFGVLNDYVVEPGDEIEQDLSAPSLTVTSPAPLSEHACHADVTVSGVATDASGVASVTVDGTAVDVDEDGNFSTVLEDLDTGTHTVEVTAVDTLGNAITIQRTFVVLECEDEDAPVITGSRSPAPNANGWNNTDVTVCFEATDESEIDYLTPCTTLSSDGAGQSVTGTATDEFGNSASTTVGNINIDKSAPSVTASPSVSCIWPPNHRMVSVTISGSVDDLSGAQTIQGFTITSNQKDDTNGDGRSTGDCNGQDGYASPASFSDSISVDSDGNFSFVVKLRAERQGNGQDRVYTVRFTVVDLAGNTTPVSTTVCVPHNQ